MGKVIFKIDETFKRIAEHAEQQGKPIMFVHDQGVYLCTEGLPAEEGSKSLMCAYAEGCDPRGGGFDWYDRARDLVGGDDFADRLGSDEARLFASAARQGLAKVIINVSETHMDIRAE